MAEDLHLITRGSESLKELAVMIDSSIRDKDWVEAAELTEKIQDYAGILERKIFRQYTRSEVFNNGNSPNK